MVLNHHHIGEGVNSYIYILKKCALNRSIDTVQKQTHRHIVVEQTQPLGGAVLYPHIAEGRGDEVQKKKKKIKPN